MMFAFGVHDAQPAFVEGQAAIVLRQRHEHGREVGEDANLFAEVFQLALEPDEGAHGNLLRFGNHLENGVAIFRLERMADAAGNDPCRMDTLAAKNADNFLSELAQLDAVIRKLRRMFGDAKQVSARRVRIHPEKKIGRAKIEE